MKSEVETVRWDEVDQEKAGYKSLGKGVKESEGNHLPATLYF